MNTNMTNMTVMIPTLEKESHDRRAVKLKRAAALKETLRAKKKGPSRPPANPSVREARRAKEKLTSVLKPMMKLTPPQWLKVEHGQNRQMTITRNTGTPKEPTVGIPRTE